MAAAGCTGVSTPTGGVGSTLSGAEASVMADFGAGASAGPGLAVFLTVATGISVAALRSARSARALGAGEATVSAGAPVLVVGASDISTDIFGIFSAAAGAADAAGASAGANTGAGGAAMTGGLVSAPAGSAACAKSGVEVRTSAAASAVMPGRSMEDVCLMRDQFTDSCSGFRFSRPTASRERRVESANVIRALLHLAFIKPLRRNEKFQRLAEITKKRE